MKVTEKFLDYVSYETTSDESSESCPSTPGQLVLGDHLVEELHRIGIDNAFKDEWGYVYGYLEGNTEGKTIGLISHMDTSDASSGKDVKPRIIHDYDGSDIQLNENMVTDVKRFPNLLNYVGKTLIVTDGTTLLGADDKAGVAIIMETLEILVKRPDFKHGLIRICFTPDEEIGRGTSHFNYDWFKVDFAYTVDGGAPNEIEFENFNAASAHVEVTGISVHPGDGKDKMVNSLNVAQEFHALLPKEARPEYTEGYEGFNHLVYMAGGCEKTIMDYIIRNHDMDLLNKQKEDFLKAQDEINSHYPANTVKVTITDSYRNMKEKFEGNREPIELVKKAMHYLKMDYKEVAIRGGTDGASLTWNGILCPNLGTGGQNYHGIHEFACVEDMEQMVKLLFVILGLAVRQA